MLRKLPPVAVVLGIAGLLPFIGCGLGAISGSQRADVMLSALIGYAAVILSFLGGVHWGFALGEVPPRQPRLRLGLSVVPALIGWVAVIISLGLSATIALGVLIAGYIATLVVEVQGRQRGLVDAGYVWLRWPLTIVAVAMLVTVLVLRLAGARIVL